MRGNGEDKEGKDEGASFSRFGLRQWVQGKPNAPLHNDCVWCFLRMDHLVPGRVGEALIWCYCLSFVYLDLNISRMWLGTNMGLRWIEFAANLPIKRPRHLH